MLDKYSGGFDRFFNDTTSTFDLDDRLNKIYQWHKILIDNYVDVAKQKAMPHSAGVDDSMIILEWAELFERYNGNTSMARTDFIAWLKMKGILKAGLDNSGDFIERNWTSSEGYRLTLKPEGSLAITIPATSEGDYSGLFGGSSCSEITATGKLGDSWDGMNATTVQNARVSQFTERSSGMVDILNRSTTHTPGKDVTLSYSFSGSALKATVKFSCQYSGWYEDSRELENGEWETYTVPFSGSETHSYTLTIPMTAEQAQAFSWRE